MTDTATTRRLVALGHDFDVETVPELASYVDDVFGALATEGTAAHHYRLTPEEGTGTPNWHLRFDGETIMTSRSKGFLYSYLCWHVNQQAIAGCDSLLLLHASCAADRDGRAVLLPASMESGKTTTVAGLVRSGLRYLTDEATALDLDSGRVVAYPKPLSVDEGSWKVLPDLEPTGDGVSEFLKAQWQVPADRFGTVARSAVPALVVSPAYTEGVGVEIEELSPAKALLTLAQNAFNLSTFDEPGFRLLEQIARRCPAYRIRYGNLDAMVETVRRLLAESAGGAE